MKIDLTGKLALVTGSAAGIGLAAARGLAVAGADVIDVPEENPGGEEEDTADAA